MHEQRNKDLTTVAGTMAITGWMATAITAIVAGVVIFALVVAIACAIALPFVWPAPGGVAW